ncbi:cation:proton antiporter [Thermus sediminis]|uniref:cation:proton antiporter n=1 Tax=Thermus sediminis TaxID=1761908 RepID=UPI000E3C84B1|nr:cation:proton antiporter family protein [Thermus sediminis]
MDVGIYTEVSLILLAAVVLGAIGLLMRQPLIITYILLGIVLGPSGFGLVQSQDVVALLAQVGIAILLFLVGLELNPSYVRRIGPVAVATGLGQLTFTIIIGFLLILLLGKDWLTALYIGVALTFSSTIIIVKLLTDKHELDTLHGRIAIGFLIVQDIAVVVALVAMSVLGGGQTGTQGLAQVLGEIALKLAVLGAGMYLAMRFLLGWLLRFLARSLELLLIFAVAWAVGLAALGDWLDLSKELGAFLAGFALSASHFRDAISTRLAPLRDFLLLFFFIYLGMKFDLATAQQEWFTALVLALFVLIGNPLIVMVIMGAMGYRRKTSFLAGLTVAQISEFSIIFIAMGMSLGHVGEDALSITTMVGLITIALSTYMILYSQPLYQRLERFLKVFERREPFAEKRFEAEELTDAPYEAIVFGLGRTGRRVLQHYHAQGIRAIGVDYDPEAVAAMHAEGIPALFGTAEDQEFVLGLPISAAKQLVITLPHLDDIQELIRTVRGTSFDGRIIAVARSEADARALRAMGVDDLVNPFELACEAILRLTRRE